MRCKRLLMKRIHGFTLIELMVTLAIAAILLTMGVPSFVTLIKDNRLTAQVNEFVASVNYARSEAIKRGLSIRVCSSSNGASCNGGTNWAQGWIVWIDLNGNGNFNNGNAESLQRIEGISTSGMTFTSGQSEYIFGPRGTSNVIGTFTLCDDRTGENGKQISIGLVGRVTLDADFTCS